MVRKFAISDIHGCPRTFLALLDKIGFTRKDELYLLGDYIDRGPNSKGVIDIIIGLQQKEYQITALRGNHEQLMLNSRTDEVQGETWKKNGGMIMLESFGIAHQEDIPESYLQWVNSLAYFVETENYILVHAGLNFDRPNPFEDTRSMMWIRDWYSNISRDWLGDRVIVHGHTPTGRQAIEDQLRLIDKQPYLDIDNGCVYTHLAAKWDMAHLCCFELTSRTLTFQANIDYDR